MAKRASTSSYVSPTCLWLVFCNHFTGSLSLLIETSQIKVKKLKHNTKTINLTLNNRKLNEYIFVRQKEKNRIRVFVHSSRFLSKEFYCSSVRLLYPAVEVYISCYVNKKISCMRENVGLAHFT